MSALVMLCLGFYACGDPDDDDGSGGNSGLVGSWERKYSTYQTETLTFGRDGRYESIDFCEGYYYKDKWHTSTKYTYKGSYSYNDATKTLVINITSQNGSTNNPYTKTYIVHTLNATTLILINSYGDSQYFNRK